MSSPFTIDQNWLKFVDALKQSYTNWAVAAYGRPVGKRPERLVKTIVQDDFQSIRDMLERSSVAEQWKNADIIKEATAYQLEHSLMGRAARDLICRYRSWTHTRANRAALELHGACPKGMLEIHLLKQIMESAPRVDPSSTTI